MIDPDAHTPLETVITASPVDVAIAEMCRRRDELILDMISEDALKFEERLTEICDLTPDDACGS